MESSQSTIVELLRKTAQQKPEQTVYRFLKNGETESGRLTYQQLDRQAQAIAAKLQKLYNLNCVSQRSDLAPRALLVYGSGLEFITAFFGCLYAGVVAVPAYPPKKNQNMSRLRAIVADAQPKAILTTNTLLANIESRVAEDSDLASIPCLATDSISDNLADEWKIPKISSDTLAFLQYTSGSTGTPKGVMVSHGNILHNQQMIKFAFGHTEKTIIVGWLPLFHDMGLIGNILQPLYLGIPCTLMSPVAFLQNPVRWLKAISRYKATTSGGPNFAYELCLQKITPEELKTIDLNSWEVAFNGAEPIRAQTIERFSSYFATCGFRRDAFYPCYGMAETTLFVSGGLKTNPPVIHSVEKAALEQRQIVVANGKKEGLQKLVGCGQAWLDEKIIIVDPKSLTKLGDRQVGEIWVSSPSVALGYWNRLEETEQVFRAYSDNNSFGPFLRTGDLGFFDDGELFVTGRHKDLIIIRGRNYYPQDIELTVEQSHSYLRTNSSAAFSVEVDGEERLVVVSEVERRYSKSNFGQSLEGDSVIKKITQSISEQYELQAYAILLLKLATIPKTSSGKIQRHACKIGFINGTLNAIKEWRESSTELQPTQEVKELQPAAEPLNSQPQLTASNNPSLTEYTKEEIQGWLISKLAIYLKVQPEKIALEENVTSFGLDSVVAISLTSDLAKWLGCEIEPTLFYDYSNIKAIAQHLFESKELAIKTRTLPEIPPQLYQFESWDEYLELQQRLQKFNDNGNPFFRVHEGISRDTTIVNSRELIDYSTYNYLGMSGDPVVSQAAKDAIDRYGTSVSASRLVSGEKQLHQELEREIADLLGTEDCIVYIGGHATNVTTIGHLFGKKDLILYDILSHNSIYQGCMLSESTALPFPHNDCQTLERILSERRHQHERVLIVVEGIYSADGDLAPLDKLIELKKHYKTLLMVDEAHSIGVLGKSGCGIGELFGVDRAAVDIWMGTLSKSFASCGGYIAGSRALVEYLKYTAPGFVFSVGISPANAASALAAIRQLRAHPERVAQLDQRGKLFFDLAQKRGLDTGMCQKTPVIPIIVGNSLTSIKLSQTLFERGISAMPMIYPAVPENAARLRFFINCTHKEEQISFTIDTLAQAFSQMKQ